MMPHRTPRQRAIALSLALSLSALLGLSLMAPAWGHAYLVKSIPAKRALLFAPPTQLQLWFNERLEPRFCTLNVNDARGQPVPLGPLQITPDDAKHLRATLPRLAPGVYTLKFRVVSVDGHVVEDRFIFTVRKPGAQE